MFQWAFRPAYSNPAKAVLCCLWTTRNPKTLNPKLQLAGLRMLMELFGESWAAFAANVCYCADHETVKLNWLCLHVL